MFRNKSSAQMCNVDMNCSISSKTVIFTILFDWQLTCWLGLLFTAGSTPTHLLQYLNSIVGTFHFQLKSLIQLKTKHNKYWRLWSRSFFCQHLLHLHHWLNTSNQMCSIFNFEYWTVSNSTNFFSSNRDIRFITTFYAFLFDFIHCFEHFCCRQIKSILFYHFLLSYFFYHQFEWTIVRDRIVHLNWDRRLYFDGIARYFFR